MTQSILSLQPMVPILQAVAILFFSTDARIHYKQSLLTIQSGNRPCHNFSVRLNHPIHRFITTSVYQSLLADKMSKISPDRSSIQVTAGPSTQNVSIGLERSTQSTNLLASSFLSAQLPLPTVPIHCQLKASASLNATDKTLHHSVYCSTQIKNLNLAATTSPDSHQLGSTISHKGNCLGVRIRVPKAKNSRITTQIASLMRFKGLVSAIKWSSTGEIGTSLSLDLKSGNNLSFSCVSKNKSDPLIIGVGLAVEH
ncbi:hypothetical protein GEMRC1_001603 [Eukaryota sp. GEM-RC1]